ncbi:retinoic acid receptor responder protein 2 isoform X3 [Panthera uncia]|uniref:retinoic acid receptor responder protein 2 isoform X3 n=1 Tax=Panthera uncia TaxID=29064 RepID=UPI0020FFBDFB|nr:retinoic acid receptor responder protein 2 isoform X3 [Panthera uncia]
MWQLLIPVALWLGMVGLGRAELTAAQQRGLQVALEEFHKHPPVQWAFKEIGVDSATDTRKRKCLACIKLNSADKVLGRMVHCPTLTQVQREPEEQHEGQCGRVERAGEDPHSYYFPGQFAFFKALPPQLRPAASLSFPLAFCPASRTAGGNQ